MTDFALSTTDIEDWAEYLGIRGVDVDVFYETYYQLDSEDYDSIMEDHLEY